MAITVDELVALPHLRLTLLGGRAGLDRTVTWAHSSDLDEPWRWLAGGELLMKNGRTLPASEEEQVAFVEHLSAALVSGLVIGSDPQSPAIAPAALRCADDVALPILSVPFSMSFIVLSRAVADALLSEEASRLARTEKIYDSIHAAVASGDPRAFHTRLEKELSCDLYVVDAETLAPVLEGTPVLPAAIGDRVRDEIGAAGGAIPGALHFVGARDDEIAIVEVPYDEPTLLVARMSSRQTYDLVLLQHAATAVAVEVAHSSQYADYQRQIGTELLSQLIQGRLDAATGASRLVRQGISPSSCRLIAIAGCDATGERRLHVGLRRRGIAHVLLRRDRVVFVLVGRDGPVVADASMAVSSLARARLGDGCTVGVSDPLGDPSRAPAASREALWALAGATSATPIVTHGEASPLPALHSPEEAHALVDRVLGSLLAYDLDNGTDLVYSLATFLSTQRSWQRCALALHVHRQTVIYRMRRVEQLTGRSLSETGDIATLWLALSALEILRQGDTPSPVGLVGGEINHLGSGD